MKRILFISHASGLFGAERSLVELIKLLDKERLVPVVVLPKKGPLEIELTNLGVITYRVRLPSWHYPSWNYGKNFRFRSEFVIAMIKTVLKLLLFGVTATVRIHSIIKKERIDLVYTNSSSIYSGALAALIARRPHLWHIHENLDRQTDGYRFILSNKLSFSIICMLSNTIIANSKSTAEQFDQVMHHNKVVVIYGGIDPEEYGKADWDIDSLEETKGKWQVAVIGTLHEFKAQDDAIRAIDIARDAIPEIKLIIIGDGRKRYKGYLMNLSNDLGLSDRVLFTGYRKDVPRILADMEAVIIPSITESFGRVAIEAMAAGVPVIAANVEGLSEIVKDDFNGILVSTRDPKAIADKLAYLFANPQKSEEYRKNAREWVCNNFSLVTYARRIEEVILSFTGASDSSTPTAYPIDLNC